MWKYRLGRVADYQASGRSEFLGSVRFFSVNAPLEICSNFTNFKIYTVTFLSSRRPAMKGKRKNTTSQPPKDVQGDVISLPSSYIIELPRLPSTDLVEFRRTGRISRPRQCDRRVRRCRNRASTVWGELHHICIIFRWFSSGRMDVHITRISEGDLSNNGLWIPRS